MASKPDDVIDQLSRLSINSAPEHEIKPSWLVPRSTREGYSFRCSLSLRQLIDQQLSEPYFRKLLFIIEEKKIILDFHMKLRLEGGQSLAVYISYKGTEERSGPVQTDLCISCDPNNPLSKLSLLEENPTTRIWLDAQLREKLIVTPRRHIERLSQMTKEEMIDFWGDTQAFLDQQQCQWQSMILNHGNYRNHAHLHLKVNISEAHWNRSIKENYREKMKEMDQLLNHSENNDTEKYFGNRKFNQWSGIKKRDR